MSRSFDRRVAFIIAVLAGLAVEPILVSACSTASGPGSNGFATEPAGGDAETSDATTAASSAPGEAGSPSSSGHGGSVSKDGAADATVADDASTGPINLPATCTAAVSPYTLAATTLDPSVVPVQVANFWGGPGTPDMRAIVTVDSTNKVYAGFTVQNGFELLGRHRGRGR